MPLFLVAFFVGLGCVHAYALLKAKAALGFGWGTAAALAPLFVALALGPLIVYFLSRHGREAVARAASWICYVWLGLLFFFLWTNLAVDLANLMLRVAGAVSGRGMHAFLIAGKAPFLALVFLSLALGTYSFFEAREIGIEQVRIVTDKLPPNTPRLRVAQISDVHLGLLVRHGKAERIVDAIRRADPDILVSTGDLVDVEINHLEGLAEIFGRIRPRLGKYAVTGNHEFYAGIEQATSFTRKAGFRVLRGETVTVGNILRIAGVDDPAGDPTGASLGGNVERQERGVLGDEPSPFLTILLKHRPQLSRESSDLFDLQLSGHTHKGQIFPFRYAVARVYPNVSGLFPLGRSFLYTSPGTGTWGPPMRFLSPPVVTFIDIERGAAPGIGDPVRAVFSREEVRPDPNPAQTLRRTVRTT